MAIQFTLPRQVPLDSATNSMAGALAYFYATLSSTPQAVYQDRPPSTPHANPLEADGNGVFPLAWYGTGLLYRLVLKNASGVTIYTEDNLGSESVTELNVPTRDGDNVFGGTNSIVNSNPRLIFFDNDSGVDQGKWDIEVDGGFLKIRSRTDADGSGIDVLTVTRGTGTAVSGVTLYQGALNLPAFTKGSFTPTWDGFSAAPTGDLDYQVIGRMVFLIAGNTNLVGTSNSTGFSLSGLPSSIQPSTNNKNQLPCVLIDNDAGVTGAFSFGTPAGKIVFAMGSPLSTTGFTNSSTKGLTLGTVLMYPL